MPSIEQEMPLLARHLGTWEGTYTHMDADSNIIDKHDSVLECLKDENGQYQQTNHYIWADGKKESIHFPATIREKKLCFDTDRITGEAWEVDDATIYLRWTNKQNPEYELKEMIQLSEDGLHRARVWQWFKGGELVKRTLIKEKRESHA